MHTSLEPGEKSLALEVDIEIERIQAIKQKAGELISSKYPDYKQLNIIRVGGAELEAMSAYIDSIREKSNKALNKMELKWRMYNGYNIQR